MSGRERERKGWPGADEEDDLSRAMGHLRDLCAVYQDVWRDRRRARGEAACLSVSDEALLDQIHAAGFVRRLLGRLAEDPEVRSRMVREAEKIVRGVVPVEGTPPGDRTGTITRKDGGAR